ncbi:hypothetical protein EAG_05436 [Camponotus floridanus]|uniref:Uncharacterized protein n=1 Tax=Camponotus floridanus TaxID=104421 RepID=E2AYA2_CAMFO|nr:hypothetical protein EAG_05436 [Camponotus floridanus]
MHKFRTLPYKKNLTESRVPLTQNWIKGIRESRSLDVKSKFGRASPNRIEMARTADRRKLAFGSYPNLSERARPYRYPKIRSEGIYAPTRAISPYKKGHISISNYIFLIRSMQHASAAILKILSKAQVAEDKRWNELRLRRVISVLTHKCNPDPQLTSHGRCSEPPRIECSRSSCIA